MVNTENGIAVVAEDYHGHPAILVPDVQNSHAWVVAEEVAPLNQARAWRDGNIVRVVGHVCSSSGASTSGKSAEVEGEECPRDPISSLAFDLAKGFWAEASTPIETDDAVIDLMQGSGTLVLALRSTTLPATGMAVIDVATSTIKTISSNATPASPFACPIDDGFIVGTSSSGMIKGADGGVSMYSGPDMAEAAPMNFQYLTMVGASDIDVTWSDLPDDMTAMRLAGCDANGVVIEAQTAPDANPVVFTINAADQVSTLTAKRLPELPKLAARAQIGVDLTGEVVIAQARRVAASENERTAELIVWDSSSSSWQKVADDLPESALIAHAKDGSWLQVVPQGASDALITLIPNN